MASKESYFQAGIYGDQHETAAPYSRVVYLSHPAGIRTLVHAATDLHTDHLDQELGSLSVKCISSVAGALAMISAVAQIFPLL